MTWRQPTGVACLAALVVLRGGAWNEWLDVNLRPEFRWYSNGPGDKQNIYGFRAVLVQGSR